MDFHYNGKLLSVEHVKRVAEMDETRDMKLALYLKLSDVETGNFQQMKVSGAMHVLKWPGNYKRAIKNVKRSHNHTLCN